jgi:hypothetical protein
MISVQILHYIKTHHAREKSNPEDMKRCMKENNNKSMCSSLFCIKDTDNYEKNMIQLFNTPR